MSVIFFCVPPFFFFKKNELFKASQPEENFPLGVSVPIFNSLFFLMHTRTLTNKQAHTDTLLLQPSQCSTTFTSPLLSPAQHSCSLKPFPTPLCPNAAPQNDFLPSLMQHSHPSAGLWLQEPLPAANVLPSLCSQYFSHPSQEHVRRRNKKALQALSERNAAALPSGGGQRGKLGWRENKAKKKKVGAI